MLISETNTLGVVPKSIKDPRKKRANTTSPKKGLFRTKKPKKEPQIALYSKEFNQLQYKWYKKAAETGFKDIETGQYSRSTQMSPINGASLLNIAKNYKPETEYFYKRLTNYLTFNSTVADEFGEPLGKRHLKACRMFADGEPYRSILKQLRKFRGRPLNLWSLSKLIKHFIRQSTIWNKTHHEGLDYVADIGS